MIRFRIWFLSILTIAILGALAYGLYLSKKQIIDISQNMVTPISILLLVLLWSFIILVIAGTLIAISYGIIHVYKFFHKHEISEVGANGSVIIRRGIHTTIAPMQTKQVQEKTLAIVPELKPIPKLRELLRSGYLLQLINSGQMLLGYTEEGIEHIGTFDDLRTCAIAGKSRYGKTVTMFFLAIQCVMAQAEITIADKHFMKDTSLTKLLEPLENYITFARQHNEVLEKAIEFENELNNRINGTSLSRKIKVLMIDEYTQLAMDKLAIKIIARIVQRTANEASGYGMFCFVGGQNWQASFSGGNALVNSLHSAIVHHIDTRESSRFLDRKFSKHTPTLKRGNVYLLDTSGDTYKLGIPLGTKEDALLLANILNHTMMNGTNIYPSPFTYQPTFTEYDRRLLDTPKSQNNNHAPLPTQPLKEQVAQHTYHLPALPDLAKNNHAPSNPVIPDIVAENVRVSPTEQVQIQKAIEQAIEQGKVKGNGKIIRTVLRDILQWDNRQYEKVKVYCDAKGY